MSVFDIRKEMVRDLDDVKLRDLLRRLLEAEARKSRIALSGIAVGGDQTAGDGGVDGSISWIGEPTPYGWLPRRVIYFQAKAEAMGKAKLGKEMRPKGVARPIFTELAASGGAYIIFSTDDPSKTGHDTRIAAMRAAVSDVPGSEAITLDIYGADKIARWANQHPGVALWLLEQLGRPVAGWRRFGPWSAPGQEGQPYLIDERARAMIDEEEVSVSNAIITMRDILSNPGGVVRLIGLSGMGKTRLAEALFDDQLDGGVPLPPDRAVYGDAGLELAVGAALMAEQVAVAGLEAVLIVDNCAQRTHGQLAEIVGRGTSRTSLLTIDYDVEGEQLAGTLVLLGGNSEDLLEGLLKQRFPDLSQAERRHLAEFSGGNARIALKIAEAGGKGIDLSKLKDSELLDRLFQTGRHEHDAKARTCAEAAAMVNAFYVSQGDGHDVEHPVLAGLAEVSAEQFYRTIATFLDWGVVQQRGPQRAVMPIPLANMIAAPAIRRSNPETLLATFLNGPRRLFASFAKRIGQLHDEPAAVAIAKRLFAADGPLSVPSLEDAHLLRAFLQAAPAAPEDALVALERALAGPDRNRFLEPGDQRKELSELLVHLAHDPKLFDRAILLLIQFTLNDGEVRSDLQARAHLLERFWPVLSFTMADQGTRLANVDRMLASGDAPVRMLGVEALDHMLKVSHFNSSLNVEFGAKARHTEWRPPEGENYEPWFDAAHDRLIAIASSGSSEAARAKDVVAENFRDHFDHVSLEKSVQIMRTARGNGYWEHGWGVLSDALHFYQRSGEAGDPDVEARREGLEALDREFRPRSLDDCFETFVLGDPWRHWHPRGDDGKMMRNSGLLARAVGRALVRNGGALGPYLDRAVNATGQNSVWSFAKGLAMHANDLNGLWEMAYARFVATPRAHPGILGGLLEGARERNRAWVEQKLDDALSDPALNAQLVTLHNAVPLDAAAVDRFSVALSRGTISTDRFSELMGGRMTRPLPGEVLARFLRELFARDEGRIPAIGILYMRIHGDRDDKRATDPALAAVGREMLADSRLYSHAFHKQDHGLARIARVVFDASDGEAIARQICVAMRINAGERFVSKREFPRLTELITQRYPLVVYDEILDKSNNDYLIERFFGTLTNDDDDKLTEPEAGAAALLDWVAQDPPARAVKVARIVGYAVEDTASQELKWSGLARALIDMVPDPLPVLLTFERRFSMGAGWGPFSLRFVRRRPLIMEMLSHEKPAARTWARDAGARLEENIRRMNETDRGLDSRFE